MILHLTTHYYASIIIYIYYILLYYLITVLIVFVIVIIILHFLDQTLAQAEEVLRWCQDHGLPEVTMLLTAQSVEVVRRCRDVHDLHFKWLLHQWVLRLWNCLFRARLCDSNLKNLKIHWHPKVCFTLRIRSLTFTDSSTNQPWKRVFLFHAASLSCSRRACQFAFWTWLRPKSFSKAGMSSSSSSPCQGIEEVRHE